MDMDLRSFGEGIDAWPALPFSEWGDTCETLHMWTQIVGKVRLAQSPWVNQSWHVPLYVTPRGLTTSTIPHGDRLFQIDFDFVADRLPIVSSDGRARVLDLKPKTTAEFYHELLGTLQEMDLPVSIDGSPNEVAEPIPFAEDTVHASYDGEYARRFTRVLVQAHRLMYEFRARFTGKVSPIHFFWGSFDLAVTRFSGRTAPEHPGGIPHLPDAVTREAYSHEVSSAGFWPGNADAPDPIFYSYAYPTPEGFSEVPVQPEGAFWLAELGEFALPYEAVRTSADPDAALMAFLQTTYDGAADLADWDRESLEWPAGYSPLD
jgi:hypothetical protein